VSYNKFFQFLTVNQVDSGQLREFLRAAGKAGRRNENTPGSRFDCDATMKGLNFRSTYLVGWIVAFALNEISAAKDNASIYGNHVNATICRLAGDEGFEIKLNSAPTNFSKSYGASSTILSSMLRLAST
jgi:hypothetical protein